MGRWSFVFRPSSLAPVCCAAFPAGCGLPREAEPVVPPLRISLRDNEVFHPTSLIGPQDQRDIQDFAATLWETLVPEPALR